MLERLRRRGGGGGRMERVGGSPEDSPSRLILINLSGFIWWGRGGDRREESEIKSEGGQPEDLLSQRVKKNGIFRRMER